MHTEFCKLTFHLCIKFLVHFILYTLEQIFHGNEFMFQIMVCIGSFGAGEEVGYKVAVLSFFHIKTFLSYLLTLLLKGCLNLMIVHYSH